MTQTQSRLYAIQGHQRSKADRIAHMIDNMAANKAYVHARAAAGGDADQSLLQAHVDRFKWYRESWRGQPNRMFDEHKFGAAFEAEDLPPLSVDLETASLCDLACPFCYRQWIATPDKIMDKDTAFRLIDEAAEMGVPSIKFNWRGEPLMNPRIADIVGHAKKRGILDTIINTNATHLDDTMARRLIDAGLDHVIYSFDGGSEDSYDKMRPGRFGENTFQDVYANIRNFAAVRAKMGSPFPFTKIQMILTDDTFDEQDTFFELFGDIIDDVSVKAYTERGGRLSDLDGDMRDMFQKAAAEQGIDPDAPFWRDRDDNLMVATGRLPCEQPYQRIMVAYDGRTGMCCYHWGNEHPTGYVDQRAIDDGDREFDDVYARAKSGAKNFELLHNVEMPKRNIDPPKQVQTLREVWHGDIVNRARQSHVEGRVEDVEICKGCPFKDTYRWQTIEV